MRPLALALWGATGALVLCGTLAAQGPARGDPAKGKAVFDYWCATCHARGPGNPGTQSLEVKYRGQNIPAALEDRTDLSPQVTALFVRKGVALMPPFRKTEIGDADLRDLSAYLAKGNSMKARIAAALAAALVAAPAHADEIVHFPPVGPKPAGVPADARAPFSSAVLAGDTLYLAGVLDLDPRTRKPGTSAGESAKLAMDALKASLEAAGFEMDQLVSVQVFATDLSSFDAFGKVYETYFNGPLPARTFVGVTGLMGGAHFELTGIAVRKTD